MEVFAKIHSLGGEFAKVKLLEQNGNNYIVEYNGKKCSAIYNCFVGAYYVDDIYGIIE